MAIAKGMVLTNAKTRISRLQMPPNQSAVGRSEPFADGFPHDLYVRYPGKAAYLLGSPHRGNSYSAPTTLQAFEPISPGSHTTTAYSAPGRCRRGTISNEWGGVCRKLAIFE